MSILSFYCPFSAQNARKIMSDNGFLNNLIYLFQYQQENKELMNDVPLPKKNINIIRFLYNFKIIFILFYFMFLE